jgi:hypothetical protein
MPQFKTGDIWTAPKNSWIVITTNSYIKKNGRLAMGKGIAKEALDRYPILDALLGGFISRVCGHLGVYGVAVVSKFNLIALQTKTHYAGKSTISLINNSIQKLKECSLPDEKINMVFPGIGYGQLQARDVYLDCLKDLSAKYTIWSKDLFII